MQDEIADVFVKNVRISKKLEDVIRPGLLRLESEIRRFETQRDESRRVTRNLARRNRKIRAKGRQDVLLTKLLNKKAFAEEFLSLLAGPHRRGFEQSLSHGFSAYCLLDLKKFKQINDRTRSHEIGDKVLKHIESCMVESIRTEHEGDILGRVGGDEFGVLMQGLSGREPIFEILRRFRRAVRDHGWIDRQKLPVTLKEMVDVDAGVIYWKNIGSLPAKQSSAKLRTEIEFYGDEAMYRAKNFSSHGAVICWEGVLKNGKFRLLNKETSGPELL